MIGSNVSTVGGISKGFIQANEWSAECIQIYTTPSRSWGVPKRSQQEIDAFHDAHHACNQVMVIAHVPFLVNLASKGIETRRKSVERLVTEMTSAEELGIDRIVLHPGNSLGVDPHIALKAIAQGINEVFSRLPHCKTMILFETMSGQGTQLGSTFQELAFILEHVIADVRLGICCDTCHMYAAGYDIRGYEGVAKVMQEFDRILGIGRIKVFHLNDSKYPLFSRIDRHCSIGTGLLGFQVFQAIVSNPLFSQLPMIVENPERDRQSLHDLSLLKGLRSSQETVIDPPLPEWAVSRQLPLIDFSFASGMM